MRIVACLIAKNEARNLPETLESLKSFCDEIVVLDTGSVDLTMEVARRYTDKVYASCRFTPRTTWQEFDFGMARNEALSYCGSPDWILSVDADETLIVPDPAAVRALLAKNAPQSFRIPIRVTTAAGSKINAKVVRLFRGNCGIAWQGSIHEVPTAVTEHTIDGLELIHRCAENSDPAKRQRNIVMLNTAFQKSRPFNRWYMYFLTQEFFMVENFYGSLGAAQLYFDLPYPAMDREWDYAVGLWLARSNTRLGAFDKAGEMADILIDEFPHFADAYYLKGDVLAFQGHFDAALEMYERTRPLTIPDSKVIGVVTDLYGDKYRDNKIAWVTAMKNEAVLHSTLFKKGIIKVA